MGMQWDCYLQKVSSVSAEGQNKTPADMGDACILCQKNSSKMVVFVKHAAMYKVHLKGLGVFSPKNALIFFVVMCLHQSS